MFRVTFAHSQEDFLTVYTAFGTMHRHCSRPVPQENALSMLLLLKAITLTSPYGFTNAKHRKSNVHNLGLLETVTTGRPVHIRQQPANFVTAACEV